MTRFAIFDTPIGPCGIAWSETGVAAIELPAATAEATRARLLRRVPGAIEAAPEGFVEEAIAAIVRLLSGEAIDLSAVPVALDGISDFNRSVYEIALTIPPGGTMSYGEIAKRLGDPLLAQAVGKALGENPVPIIIPCHRVLAAGGRIGGFSGAGGIATKRRMLAIESVHARGEPTLFDLAR